MCVIENSLPMAISEPQNYTLQVRGAHYMSYGCNCSTVQITEIYDSHGILLRLRYDAHLLFSDQKITWCDFPSSKITSVCCMNHNTLQFCVGQKYFVSAGRQKTIVFRLCTF